MQQLNEQQLLRRERLAKIEEMGINPFPPEGFDVNAFSTDIKENYSETIAEDGTKEIGRAPRLNSSHPSISRMPSSA